MIRVIGIGEDGWDGLPDEYRQYIATADVLVGGERQLQMIPPGRAERIPLRGGIRQTVKDLLQRRERNIVVLASGDPLFYGIGGMMSRLAGKGEVQIHPSLSSMQLAFARLQESWQDARCISLHGRPITGLAQKVDGADKIALLTDEENTPARIARYLLDFGFTEYEAAVLEHLGGDKERVVRGTLAEVAEQSYAPLNLMVLLRRGESPFYPLGIPDECFAQRKPERGLITKREVRLVSLSSLALREDSVVWDIGAGSGSVAIEAARIARWGSVFAIEKNEEDVRNIRENMRRFRTDITLVHDKAPAGLAQWPDPDAVFIGGSGGELRNLLSLLASRLRPGGRIVLNAATLENLQMGYQGLREEGFSVSVTQVLVSRSQPILGMTRLAALHPVFVLTAERKEEKGKDEDQNVRV